MMTDEEKIARRIAVPEVGYPYSEALFWDEAEYWEHVKIMEEKETNERT